MPEKESGQMSDPGRVHQIAQGQAPTGQKGVQVGKINHVPVTSGQPQ